MTTNRGANMNLTTTGSWRFIVALVSAFYFANVESTEAAQPNVILIMADDFGYECVGANGGESYSTPNLDRLAASGVRFTNCHVQPLCTPTRIQLMTGRYNIRNYINFGTLVRTETTFGQVAKTAGYATGICGKWQLGRELDSPQHFGFDESYLWQHTRRPPRYANAGLEHNGKELDFSNGEYGPTLVNEFALDFIQRHQKEPFFLYYPMILTHDPFQPTPDSPDWDPAIKDEQKKRDEKHFAEMVSYMDKLIGILDKKLSDLGIRDNTLLVFLGDNGTGRGVKTRFQGREYLGGKGSTVANGTHVPLIVSWPSVIQKPSVCEDLISSVDFFPTVLNAIGADPSTGEDGVSFLPQVRGESGTPRKWLYHWYSPRQKVDMKITEYAFDHHYKLYRDGRFFDLAKDPQEANAISVNDLGGNAKMAYGKLSKALELFDSARPRQLDEDFLAKNPQSTTTEPKQKKNRKKKAEK